MVKSRNNTFVVSLFRLFSIVVPIFHHHASKLLTLPSSKCIPSLVKISQGIHSVDCSQGCYSRTYSKSNFELDLYQSTLKINTLIDLYTNSCTPSLVKIGQWMFSVECPQCCCGRTHGNSFMWKNIAKDAHV